MSSTPQKRSPSRPCATFCPEAPIMYSTSWARRRWPNRGFAMLGVGGGLYLVGVAKPEVDIAINIFGAIGGQRRVQGVNFGSTHAKRYPHVRTVIPARQDGPG